MDSGDWKDFLVAASQGDLPKVQYYLQSGMDPNFQHVEIGSTALIEAAGNGQLEVVKQLIAVGADPLIVADFGGYTAVQLAKNNGQSEVFEYLKQFTKRKKKGFWSFLSKR